MRKELPRETIRKIQGISRSNQKNQESKVQEIVVVRDSDNFSTGQTASIGAGAAAGGAGLAFTIPVLGKWLMRFFR